MDDCCSQLGSVLMAVLMTANINNHSHFCLLLTFFQWLGSFFAAFERAGLEQFKLPTDLCRLAQPQDGS